jgi:hypothetical protein
VNEGAIFLAQQPQGGLVATRVGDGTQAAATGSFKDTVPTVILSLTALWTGSFGNNIIVSIVAGSKPSTLKIIVQPGTYTNEIFDNIPTTGSALAAVAAINTGTANVPASKYIVAAKGPSSVELTAATTATLTGGLDGVASITTANLLGVDGSGGSRTGMYALRKMGMDVFWLAGCTDTTSWSTMLTFALSETCMAIGSLPINTQAGAAVTAVNSAGVSSPWLSIMVDHLVYFDSYLNSNVYLAPACILAGICCSNAPWESPGNTPVYGILGTDKTYGPSAQPHSNADEAALETIGIDFVALPIPGANALGIRHGKNSGNSSSFATGEIAYTRMTNSLSRAFSSTVMGQFVDQPQSILPNDPLREAVRNAFNSYLGPLVGVAINAFYAQCDLSNNPVANIKIGILQADVTVQYLAIVNKFLINLTAGQTVTVQTTTAHSGSL